MSMNAEDIKAVVIYRKEKAYVTLREAEDMIATEHWNLAMQRLYYACFYMASALLISAGIKAHTHNGVQNRITGDYNDFFDFESEDVLPLIKPVKNLLAHLDNLIKLD